jgi:hypothetical protein
MQKEEYIYYNLIASSIFSFSIPFCDFCKEYCMGI